MAKKMLIDAAHPEQTRVVVVSGNRVEEFDFETLTKKQLKGNIYLAKVTRVEPSLQAAFVEYGGNRHGFLAFSEIHPDYYQIPVADRLALLQEQADARRDEDDDDDDDGEEIEGEPNAPAAQERRDTSGSVVPSADELSIDAQRAAEEALLEHPQPASDRSDAPTGDERKAEEPHEAQFSAWSETEDPARAQTEKSGLEAIEISTPSDASGTSNDDDELPAPERENRVESVETSQQDAPPEEVGAQDAMEELPRRRRKPVRRYKIQEVIRRRQILLVQVVKEERGNKGAALTTFLSLAGRYCVLMPNTDRGGGISRKITSGSDRKRLKDIAVDLEVPEGMGLIVRTAGANRTRAELKRDFEYLLRLWESVRELTLQSTAPALVYEEGNLVKRSIRDLYGRDIDEVLVEGAEAYKEAKAFMKMLTPSHAKNVQQYTDKLPLFQRYQVETQLDSLYSPRVELRSGGYIVINSTEALVAIDVNSGKATREHSIEETALQTNSEAAEEVARQLRMRDLAGLIVIDFIDMEEHRHDRHVERKLKDALKTDRARIQVGRISPFGLLEMSRQRLRASVLEGSTLICAHCEGAGRVPSTESTALRILRAIEEEGIRGRMEGAQVKAPPEVALYLLNYKRHVLQQIEERFGLPCYIEASPDMLAGHYVIDRAPEGLIDWRPAQAVISPESGFTTETEEVETSVETEEAEAEPEIEEPTGDRTESRPEEIRVRSDERGEGDGRRGRRRRRRGGRHGEDRDAPREARAPAASPEPAKQRDAAEDDAQGPIGEDLTARPQDSPEERDRKRRRRGRRGGRRNRRRERDGSEAGTETRSANANGPPAEQVSQDGYGEQPEYSSREEYVPRTDDHERPLESERITVTHSEAPEPLVRERSAYPQIEVPEPERPTTTQAAPETGNGHAPERAESEPARSVPQEPEVDDPNRPRRKGWWQRKIFG